MADYLPLFIMFALATLFAAGSFIGARVLAPSSMNAAKRAPYECGIVPRREPAERFPVRFYLIAMIFIIFDIEIIFLFPWAVQYEALGVFGLAEMVVFAVAVFVSFTYLVSNGALDWGPSRSRRSEFDDRTAASAVRLVASKPAPQPASDSAA